jgi:hypothetical protein
MIYPEGPETPMKVAPEGEESQSTSQFAFKLPPELARDFRKFVVNEHGSYYGGWLSFECERALRAYLALSVQAKAGSTYAVKLLADTVEAME